MINKVVNKHQQKYNYVFHPNNKHLWKKKKTYKKLTKTAFRDKKKISNFIPTSIRHKWLIYEFLYPNTTPPNDFLTLFMNNLLLNYFETFNCN